MFKEKIVGLLLILIGLMAYSVWVFRAPSPRDYHAYERLMSYSDDVKELPMDQNMAKQQRHQVQKQFVFFQDKNRLQVRLKCDTSEVSLDQNGNSVEFVEYLQNMACTMQEKIQSEDQLVRCLDAKKAVYNYKWQRLTADDVNLTRYKVPGHVWTNHLSEFKPFMAGRATSIELTLARQPLFKARGFQASFQDWE